jgi:EmrB/QacA subfamily drug resistance transporter
VTPPSTTEYYENSRFAQKIVVVILCIGVSIGPLMLASVNVAIPSIANELKASARLMSWVPMAFTLSNVIFLLPIGRCADRFGRKKIFQLGIILTLIGSILGAFSPNIVWLLISRIVQGVGGAMIYGTGMAIVTSVVSKPYRGTSLGLVSACVFISLTVSPFIGGIVTDHFGWRAVMLIPVPVGIISLTLFFLFVKGEWLSEVKTRFDFNGTMIFAMITCIFVFGLSSLPSLKGGISLFISFTLIVIFIYYQSKIDYGIVNIQLIRSKPTFSYALTATFFMYTSNFGIIFLLSLYLQYIGSLSASQAGSLLVYQALMMAISSVIAGRISDRMESRYLSTLGCAITVSGYAWLAYVIDYGTPHWQIIACQMLVGFGFGFFSTPNNSAALGSVDSLNLGSASAMINLSRNVGNLIAMGIVTLLMSIYLGSNQITEDNYDLLLKTIKITIFITLLFSVLGGVFSALRGGSNNPPPNVNSPL